MKTLITILLIAALGLPLSAWPDAGNIIKISADHIANLGIGLGKLAVVSQVPVLYAPAKAVIPPSGEYVVSASQAGQVAKLLAGLGDSVKKGQLLAELNSSDLVTMQQQYLSANSELHLQQLAYEREKKLYEDGIVAKRRWLETESLYHASAYAASEHRQLLVIAGMTGAEIDLLTKTHKLSGRLHIRAPIAGVVMERMALAGERVDSLTPLYRIADLRELWLEINIPQERMGDIGLGDTVLLEKPVADNSDLELRKNPVTMPVKAQITLLGQNVNPENQTVVARAVINGIQNEVRPGQRINVQVVQKNSNPAFSVPNTAIIQHRGQSYLFVRNAEGFIAQPVTVIGKQDDKTTLTGDLKGNEDIAITGAVALKANWLGLGSED